MKHHPLSTPRFLFLIFLSFIITNDLSAQSLSKIDWKNDTISKEEANTSRNKYREFVKGKATELVRLPVNKLKEIMDACNANGVDSVDVLIGKVESQKAIEHQKKFNKNKSNEELYGAQILIFRVPVKAFEGKKGAKLNLSNNNPLMLSLLSAGLVIVDAETVGIAGTEGFVYFSFGSICPPPASCD